MARPNTNTNTSIDSIVTQRVRAELSRLFAPIFAANVVRRRRRSTSAAATGTSSTSTAATAPRAKRTYTRKSSAKKTASK